MSVVVKFWHYPVYGVVNVWCEFYILIYELTGLRCHLAEDFSWYGKLIFRNQYRD